MKQVCQIRQKQIGLANPDLGSFVPNMDQPPSPFSTELNLRQGNPASSLKQPANQIAGTQIDWSTWAMKKESSRSQKNMIQNDNTSNHFLFSK